MTSVGTRLTAEEFAQLPEDPDGGQMELVAGEVVVVPPPSFDHGEIAAVVHERLRQFLPAAIRVNENAGFVVDRNPDHVRAPDVAAITNVAARERTAAGYIVGAPDLAVEVVSPGDRAPELETKVRAYLAAGARRVWVVWPQRRSVTVHRPDGTSMSRETDAELSADDAGFDVPEFVLTVAELFPSSLA